LNCKTALLATSVCISVGGFVVIIIMIVALMFVIVGSQGAQSRQAFLLLLGSF
jgi:hypothetical protein